MGSFWRGLGGGLGVVLEGPRGPNLRVSLRGRGGGAGRRQLDPALAQGCNLDPCRIPPNIKFANRPAPTAIPAGVLHEMFFGIVVDLFLL